MKRLGSAIILLSGIVTIVNFMMDKGLWPATRSSFFNDWIPWITVVLNMSALIALLYCWIVLQALKKDAIEHRALIEKLSKDLTSNRSALDGYHEKSKQ